MIHHHGKNLKLCAALTGLFFVFELISGFLSGSLALISDAGHMFVDMFSILIVIFSLHLKERPATKQKTYGYYRAEILASLFNGALLLYGATQILIEAASRIYQPNSIELGIMIPVALLGLSINIICAFLLHGHHDHLATRSAYFHVLADALSSLGVLITGIIMYYTSWTMADPIVSVAIAIMLLIGAFNIIKESADVLMEASPNHINVDEVRTKILNVQGVEDLHDLHIWVIASNHYALSAHLIVKKMDVMTSEKIVRAVSKMLREEFSISHTTLQTECIEKNTTFEKINLICN